jgi:hypothetical protein
MIRAIGPMGWIGLILFFGVGLVVAWCAAPVGVGALCGVFVGSGAI